MTSSRNYKGREIAQPAPKKIHEILFVDLDDTLVATDVLREAAWLAIRKKPWLVPKMPFWLLRGRAALKRALAERIQLDASNCLTDKKSWI